MIVEKVDSATALSQPPVRPIDWCTPCTAHHAWNAYEVYCVPRSELSRYRLNSDNGDALIPIRRGITSELVAYANSLGVATITGKPYRPTTQGKNERFHSTLFKWLKKRPFAKDLAELQAQVDVFDQAYNTQRGHQSLEDRCTPQEA
ncbi:hypothetical protein C1H84_04060 [Glutamicibacter soli]|uniref:Integrase catalytic domain-containing protein n=1 Tax=Glutamicibacter soli TaxID=453836 RepID=A0A365YK37_9MICC|nr:hypothetical protein C1H84_04060 [Glutamicibacter soli]